MVAGLAIVYAGVVLYFLPEKAAQLFAWNIQPSLTAVFMGALYFTGIPGLFLAARAGTRWQQVRAIMPSLFTLSASMLIATLFHLDRFLWGNPVTWLWLILYIVVAPLIAILTYQHRRDAVPEPAPRIPVTPLMQQLAYTTVILFVIGLLFLVLPQTMAPLWPWRLTPLTGRVTGGFLMFLAVALAGVARERDWMAMRLFLPGGVLAFALLAISIPRFWGEYNLGLWQTWLYFIIVIFGLLVTAYIYFIYEAQRRRIEGQALV